MKTKIFRVLLLLALAFSALLPATLAKAVVLGCSWNGSVDANWSTAGNWSAGCSGAGGIPGSGDALTFPTGMSNTTMNDDLPSISLNSLNFTSSLGYILNGSNAISLSGGIDVQGGTQVVNAPLAVLNAGVILHVANGSSLAIGGTLNLGIYDLSATVDTAAGVTGLQFLGNVNGSGAAKVSKNGTGDLQFSGADHLSIFDIDVNAGSVSTSASIATYLPWSGKITLASGTDLNLQLAGVIGAIAGSGDIHAASFFQIRQHRTTTFTGDIFGSNQLAIIGDGVNQLTIDRSGGSLSYTGEIQTSTYLKLYNTNAASVTDFLVEQYSGILELNNSQVGTILVGFSPPGADYDGSLVLTGATASTATQITMANNSSITSVVNSATDYGRITVTSPVDLGSGTPSFSLQGSYVPNPGDEFDIIQNVNSGAATLSNAVFPALPQGGTLTFNTSPLTADYQASGNTTFALNAVPPTAPLLASPANLSSLNYNRPVFDWLDFAGAVKYQFQVSKVPTFKSLVLNKNTTASTYTTVANLPANMLLYWRVRAKVGPTFTPWSDVWSFTTANPPSVPALSSPAKNALVAGPSPLFIWKASTVPTGATFDHYQIQIATDKDFTAIVHDRNISGLSSLQDATATLSWGNQYYWRVRSYAADGDYSLWSTVNTVRIKYIPTTLTWPLNGATTSNLKPQFNWDAFVGAKNYTIQVSKIADFKKIVINKTVTYPPFTALNNLTAGTTYYWRVKVNGLFGPSDWSPVFSFTTP